MYIDALTDSVSSLEELLTNLLEWTRYEAKRIEYNPLKFDVKALCFDEIVPLYNTIVKKKNIIVKEGEASDSDNCYVFSDIKMVSTILRNLVSNALKFSHENAEVVLCFIDEGDCIRIVVKDNGVGIPEEKKKLLLSGKTFTTSGTNGEEGNGIGLEIVNKMLSICESKLHIESAPGKGSEFSFKLKKENG
jgi:two-component system sensor histidine kinase/response regulator